MIESPDQKIKRLLDLAVVDDEARLGIYRASTVDPDRVVVTVNYPRLKHLGLQAP